MLKGFTVHLTARSLHHGDLLALCPIPESPLKKNNLKVLHRKGNFRRMKNQTHT